MTQAQTMQDLFQESTVPFYWFGIDFSHVQLIASFAQSEESGEKNAELLKNKYFKGWNNLFIYEADKYNVSEMLHKKSVEINLDPITKINNQANVEEMEVTKETHYTADQIKEFVKDYDFDVKEGIGVFFIAECLNKPLEHGIYHVVFINLANNEVLHTQSITGETGGFGVRNYYARSYLEVMESIQKTQYKKWKKLYFGK